MCLLEMQTIQMLVIRAIKRRLTFALITERMEKTYQAAKRKNLSREEN